MTTNIIKRETFNTYVHILGFIGTVAFYGSPKLYINSAGTMKSLQT